MCRQVIKAGWALPSPLALQACMCLPANMSKYEFDANALAIPNIFFEAGKVRSAAAADPCCMDHELHDQNQNMVLANSFAPKRP